jgi:membrane protease YdiL (CAAX protease family)
MGVDRKQQAGGYGRQMLHVVAAVLATALALGLVLVQPWVGRRRYRRLLAALETKLDARLHHFRRAIIGEWAVSIVILGIGAMASYRPASIGLGVGPHPASAAFIVAEVTIALAVSALVFRFGGTGITNALRRQARGFEALLPRGRRERITFAALAITAGICEELIFRGFGIAYLRWLWPGSPRSAVILITAAAFGFGHLYQGVRGVVLTGLVGGYFAWLVLSTGSLWPAMAIHGLLDLRILALPDLGVPAETEHRGGASPAPAPSSG